MEEAFHFKVVLVELPIVKVWPAGVLPPETPVKVMVVGERVMVGLTVTTQVPLPLQVPPVQAVPLEA